MASGSQKKKYLSHNFCVQLKDPNYVASRNRVGEVGRTAAAYIDWLNTRGLPFANIVVLGKTYLWSYFST